MRAVRLGLVGDAPDTGGVAHGRDRERPLVPPVEDVLAREAAIDQRAGLELPKHPVLRVRRAGAPDAGLQLRGSRSAPGPSAFAGRCGGPRRPRFPAPDPTRRRCTPTEAAPDRSPSPRRAGRSGSIPAGRALRPRAGRSAGGPPGTRRRAPALRSPGPPPPAAARADAPAVHPRAAGCGLGREQDLVSRPDGRQQARVLEDLPRGVGDEQRGRPGRRHGRGTPNTPRRRARCLTRGTSLWSGPPRFLTRAAEGLSRDRRRPQGDQGSRVPGRHGPGRGEGARRCGHQVIVETGAGVGLGPSRRGLRAGRCAAHLLGRTRCGSARR
jgi:hypothetical protein